MDGKKLRSLCLEMATKAFEARYYKTDAAPEDEILAIADRYKNYILGETRFDDESFLNALRGE